MRAAKRSAVSEARWARGSFRRTATRSGAKWSRLFAIALFALACGGCFNVDKPTCSYACGDTDPKCPEDYECRSDGYCHLTGTTEACAFADAAVPLDMSSGTTTHDLAHSGD
jgi:hypothetical protein